MDWTHGYFAESGYSYGYYPELMPARLRWASLLHGHPLPEKGFRYLDAGFGQGVNLVLAAAMYPDAEFVGIDFLPEHVAHATELARRCGLTNITLIEGDFLDLAKDPLANGQFDIAVCHGISSWISPDVQKALFGLIGHALRPGGVFYNSYNTLPGWLGAVPFQHLVLLEQRSKSGMEALTSAIAGLQQLEKTSDFLYKAQPSLPQRLKGLDGQDPAYLVQEYNNRFWQPIFVSQMIDHMSAVKLDFLGTATLADIFDSAVKPEVRELLKAQPNTILREQMRDYAFNQSFRRDIYVKGKRAKWTAQLNDLLQSFRVRSNALAKRPDGEEPFKIKASHTELSGNHAYYTGLLKQLDESEQGLTIAELIQTEPDANRKRFVIETVSMMLHGGWVTPALSDPNPRGPQIGEALATAVCEGAPYRMAPLPAAGVAMPLSDTDWMILKAIAEGTSEADLPQALSRRLERLGRQVAKDGEAVTDPQERSRMLNDMVATFMTAKVPYLRNSGLI